jgi:hypothetical protein
LGDCSPPIEGLTSLAEGADQVFAEAVLRCGGSLHAIIPITDYEKCFQGEPLKNFIRLKKKSDVTQLQGDDSPQRSFLNAGRYIADHADLLIAVWDGEPAVDLGGTADVVEYALQKGKRVVQIDPVARSVRSLRDAAR